MKKRYTYSIFFLVFAIISQFTFAYGNTGFYSENNKSENSNNSTINGDLANDLIGESAILIDADTGIILFDKNINDIKYPASITKIMTALIALENCQLDDRVVFSHNAVFSIPYGSSHIAMDEDESLSMEQALYALLLESANEVANAIAEHISGSNEEFAVLMNKKAKELGANNTNFVNPHGLHDENHYTTAYDMSLIMAEAIKNPKFVDIISTHGLKLPPTEKQSEERPLNNSHKMIYEFNSNYYPSVVGGKTGFTSEAGNTLVTYANKDGKNLIAVVLHNTSAKAAYTDTAKLFDYGYDMYSSVPIFNSLDFNSKNQAINIICGGKEDCINELSVLLYTKDDIYMNLPNTIDLENIVTELNFSNGFNKSIKADEKVGILNILYNNTLLTTVDILSKEDVEIPELSDYLSANKIDEDSNEKVAKKASLLSGFKLEEGFSFKNTALILVKIAIGIILVLLVIAIVSRINIYHRRKEREKRRNQVNRIAKQRIVRDYKNY